MKTYSVKEIANLLDTNPETVRRWIRDGKLQAVEDSRKKGENKVILESALNAFLNTSPKYAAVVAGSFSLGAGVATLGVAGVANALIALKKAESKEIAKARVDADSVYTFLTVRIEEERTKLEKILEERKKIDLKIQIETELLNQLLDRLNGLIGTAVNQQQKTEANI